MDCGGGSYDQMAHFFNKDLETELAKVKMIFISHLHLDHHAVSMMEQYFAEEKLSLDNRDFF